MKQSKKVIEASRRALNRLSRMTKAELGQRLSERKLGPVGQLLLAVGSMEVILRGQESQWMLEKGVISLQIGKRSLATQKAFCADVMYELVPLTSWSKVSHSSWDVIEPMVKQWASAT